MDGYVAAGYMDLGYVEISHAQAPEGRTLNARAEVRIVVLNVSDRTIEARQA